MRKSQTGVFLPSIKPQRTSLSGRSKMKSFFLQRVKQEVTEEPSYEAMESSLITQQQKKLKNLLRQFNDRSQSILADYIAIPIRPKDASPPKQNIQEVRKVLEQEEAILAKMREQCQTQLKLLENRCQELKYTTRQQMERQIRQTKLEIEQIKVTNKQLSRDVTLNGLNICKDDPFDLVKELEVQKIEVDARLVKLQSQEPVTLKQIQNLKSKAVSADQQIAKIEADYKIAMNQQQQEGKVNHLKEEAKTKTKQIEYTKIKNQQAAGAIKQKYLTKLKQLDETRGSEKKMIQQILKHEEELGRTRKELIILEHKFSALKQKVPTVHLLTKK